MIDDGTYSMATARNFKANGLLWLPAYDVKVSEYY
jgi:hypothetical protein